MRKALLWHYKTKKFQNWHWVPFLLYVDCWLVIQVSVRRSLSPQWDSLEILCLWLPIGDCFWIRNESSPLLLFSEGPVYPVSVSETSYSHWPVLSERSSFLVVLYHFWCLQSFCLLFHRIHWALGKDLMDTSHLELRVPRSLTFYTMSLHNGYRVSVFFPYAVVRRSSNDDRARHPSMSIVEYH